MNLDRHAEGANPVFDPLSPDFIRDPYPTYERLRGMDPMHRTSLGLHLASRHADVNFVLRDKRFGKKFAYRMMGRLGPQIMEEPAYRSMRHWILQQDPPDHTRLRGLVVKAFAARKIEDMRPRIQRIVDDRLDRVVPRRHMDVVADFAQMVPLAFICDMLGIPEDYHEVFRKIARDCGRLLDPVLPTEAEIDAANASTLTAHFFCQQMFEEKRRKPSDDLMTQLVRAEQDGVLLSHDELTASIILMFGAGHETTLNMIGNGLLALHRNPDQLALLRSKPALMQNAVEELLRYESSAQSTGRVALEDVDDVGGRRVLKGEGVLCLLGSANRDPSVYVDQPDRLDITRAGLRPLFFGGGIHFCMGAQLARIQIEIALATLLRRLPTLRLDDVDNPEWRTNFVLRGLERLPASW